MEAGASKVPVGQVIAILAEEGDDLSSLEIPSNLGPEGESSTTPKKEEPKKEEAAPVSAKQESQPPASKETKESKPETGHGHKTIKHSKPLFPSVSRL